MRSIIRPSLYGLGITILWVALASATPTTTYHLAPLLVAIAVPVGSALNARLTTPSSISATAIGMALALAATAGLGLNERLAGPSLLPTGGAVLESVVFAAGGAAVGLIFAIWKHR